MDLAQNKNPIRAWNRAQHGIPWISVELAPFQAREARAFPPEPSAGRNRPPRPATMGCLSRRPTRSELQHVSYAGYMLSAIEEICRMGHPSGEAITCRLGDCGKVCEQHANLHTGRGGDRVAAGASTRKAGTRGVVRGPGPGAGEAVPGQEVLYPGHQRERAKPAGILRAAKGCQLVVNASASVYNEI